MLFGAVSYIRAEKAALSNKASESIVSRSPKVKVLAIFTFFSAIDYKNGHPSHLKMNALHYGTMGGLTVGEF